MGVIAFTMMIVLKKMHCRIPPVLAAVVVTTILSWAFLFEQHLVIHQDMILDPQTKALLTAYYLGSVSLFLCYSSKGCDRVSLRSR